MSNPFPGLRPFQLEESHLFFGREEQTGQLLERLGTTRFLAVVGASGSGKSSLVRAGLLPQLYGGTMVKTSVHWEIAIMRPGGDPITNLARSLVESDIFEDESEDQVQLLRTMLSRSGLGLLEAYRQSDIEPGSNLLILVDQFEEIFRFRQSDSKASEEAADFIELILEASWQEELPIYVILTMRSDFLGDCAEFKNLAEAVNEGEYLIPRLNRRQRALAIEGPAKVGGGEMSPRLVQQLLNDIGDDPDQLPILQHSLMRTWEYWEGHNQAKDKPLDVEHYRAIGTMEEALSRHADEAHNELPDDHHRKICERMFKSITERGNDGRGIRRPLPFSDLVEIVGGDEQALMKVIDDFRTTNRSFIMPLEHTQIHIDTVIDISHESLMRVWERLRGWVDEESQSARIYRRLAETSALHASGEAGLYHDPDLRIAITWREEHHPNERWASRYSGDFHAAMKFLEDSQTQKEADEKAKEEARKRELEQAKALAKAEKERADIQRKSAKRNKIFAVFLSILAFLAGVMAYQATQAEKRAVASEKKAKDNLSYSYANMADRMLMDNYASESFALLGQKHLENKDYSIIPKKIANQLNHNPFLRKNKTSFKNPEDILLRSRKGFIYTSDYADCIFLHNSKDEAYVKRVNLDSGKEIFKTGFLNYVDELNISPKNNYVFVTGTDLNGNLSGMAIDSQNGKFVKKYTSSDTITAITGRDDLSRIIVGDISGKIKIYDSEDEIIYQHDFKNKIHQLKIHPDGNSVTLLSLENDSYYDIWKIGLLDFESKLIYQSPRDQYRWEAWMEYSRKGDYLLQFGGDWTMGNINVFDAKNDKLLWSNDTSHEFFVITVDLSHDQTSLTTSSIDKTTRVWDIKTGKEIMRPLRHDAGVWYSVYSPDQMKIATLTAKNDVWVWSAKNRIILNYPTRQTGELVGISFNSRGDKLYAASIDGDIVEWDLNVSSFRPKILTHDAMINVYDMSSDGRYAVTGGRDNRVRIWDTKELRLHKEAQLSGEVASIVYSEDNSKIIVVEGTGYQRVLRWSLFSMPDGELINSKALPPSTRKCFVSKDCKTIVYGLRNNLVHILNAEEGKIAHEIDIHGGWIEGVEFSPNSDKFITIGKDGIARMFDSSTGKLLHSNVFRALFAGRCAFSEKGDIYVLYCEIGMDAPFPTAYDATSGKRLFNLKHGSGVNELSFTSADSRLLTVSRDFTAKLWDRDNVELPLQSYAVGDWVSSALLKDTHKDRVFTFSRRGDIYVFDTKSELLIDGPYRGADDCGWFSMKLKTKPQADYFLAINTPSSVAVWPLELGEFNIENTEKLVQFSSEISGVTMDQTMALQLSTNVVNNLTLNDSDVREWHKWHKSGNSLNTPFTDREPEQYRQFLISQNTLSSLEEILYNYPMDKEVLKLYAKKLFEFSKDKSIESFKRDRYKTSAIWYESIAE